MKTRAARTTNLRSRPVTPPGPCACGAAVVDITPAAEVAMAGYSTDGSVGRPGAERLFARAVVLAAGDDLVAWCVADVWCGSSYLVARVADLLADIGLGADRLVIGGTHTHTGPGQFMGNGFYDTFAQCEPGFDEEIAEPLAEGVALAIRQAFGRRRPARVGSSLAAVWGASRNRSLLPFEANFRSAGEWSAPGWPGHGAPPGLSPQQRSVDPRLWTLAAVDAGGRLIACFGTFSCHATALGPETEELSRDWPGVAVDTLERALAEHGHGGAVVALAQSAAGDVSPLPPEDVSPLPPEDAGAWHGPTEQGPGLARWVGERVAEAWCGAALVAMERAAPFELGARLGLWAPLDRPEGGDGRIATWNVGWPLLAGAEDSRTSFFRHGVAFEGMTSDHFDDPERDANQAPKKPFLGALQSFVQRLCGWLAPSRWHALHVVRIADTLLATVPGEPTTAAAHRIERALLQAWGDDPAAPRQVVVLGYTGDYAGYFTTEPEYELQHYEGAHTIYGRHSLAALSAALEDLAGRLRTDEDAEHAAELEVLTLGPAAARAAWQLACAAVPHDERAELAERGPRRVLATVAQTPAGLPVAPALGPDNVYLAPSNPESRGSRGQDVRC